MSFTISRQILTAVGIVVCSVIVGVAISAYTWGAEDSGATAQNDPYGPSGAGLADAQQVVDRGQLDDAFAAMLQCLDNQGVEYQVAGWQTAGFVPMWDYTVGPFDSPDGSGSRAYDDCWARHLRSVQGAWALQHQPTAAERQGAEQRALACAAGLGANLEEFDTIRTLVREPTADGRSNLMPCFLIGVGARPLD